MIPALLCTSGYALQRDAKQVMDPVATEKRGKPTMSRTFLKLTVRMACLVCSIAAGKIVQVHNSWIVIAIS